MVSAPSALLSVVSCALGMKAEALWSPLGAGNVLPAPSTSPPWGGASPPCMIRRQSCSLKEALKIEQRQEAFLCTAQGQGWPALYSHLQPQPLAAQVSLSETQDSSVSYPPAASAQPASFPCGSHAFAGQGVGV